MEDVQIPMLRSSDGRVGVRTPLRPLLVACLVTAVITALLTMAVMLTAGRPLLVRGLLPSGVRVPAACWANATSWRYSETHVAEPELGLCMDMQMVQCIAYRLCAAT